MYSNNVWAVLVAFAMYAQHVFSLICYNCYDTGPTNTGCVKSKNCTGTACLVYEDTNIVISTAFCLFILPSVIERRRNIDRQCWFEPNGKGKHCICGEDFCNRLRDRTYLIHIDPLSLPIENATLVKQNPLIVYEDANSAQERAMQIRNIPFSPAPAHIHPQHAADDPRTLNVDDEDDLVPINHDDYINNEFREGNTDKIPKEQEKSLEELSNSAWTSTVHSSLYLTLASVIIANLLP